MKLFDERNNYLVEISDADARKLKTQAKAEDFFEKRGRRKAKLIGLRLLPPPPPPSDSPDSPTTISLSEMLANAGVQGSRSRQIFAQFKVQQFAIRSWSDRVVMV